MGRYWSALLYSDKLEEKVEKYEEFLMHLYVTTPHLWLRKDIHQLLDLGPETDEGTSSGGSTAAGTGT